MLRSESSQAAIIKKFREQYEESLDRYYALHTVVLTYLARKLFERIFSLLESKLQETCVSIDRDWCKRDNVAFLLHILLILATFIAYRLLHPVSKAGAKWSAGIKHINQMTFEDTENEIAILIRDGHFYETLRFYMQLMHIAVFSFIFIALMMITLVFFERNKPLGLLGNILEMVLYTGFAFKLAFLTPYPTSIKTCIDSMPTAEIRKKQFKLEHSKEILQAFLPAESVECTIESDTLTGIYLKFKPYNHPSIGILSKDDVCTCVKIVLQQHGINVKLRSHQLLLTDDLSTLASSLQEQIQTGIHCLLTRKAAVIKLAAQIATITTAMSMPSQRFEITDKDGLPLTKAQFTLPRELQEQRIISLDILRTLFAGNTVADGITITGYQPCDQEKLAALTKTINSAIQSQGLAIRAREDMDRQLFENRRVPRNNLAASTAKSAARGARYTN